MANMMGHHFFKRDLLWDAALPPPPFRNRRHETPRSLEDPVRAGRGTFRRTTSPSPCPPCSATTSESRGRPSARASASGLLCHRWLGPADRNRGLARAALRLATPVHWLAFGAQQAP